MTPPRIYVDFQGADAEGRIWLNCKGTFDDLAAQKVDLKEGMPLTLYSDDLGDDGKPDDLIVEGTATYSNTDQCWVAVIDWNAIRHASELGK